MRRIRTILMKPDSIVIVVAIGAIAGLVGFGIAQGLDGTLLSLGVAAIAALGGIKIRDILDGRGK